MNMQSLYKVTKDKKYSEQEIDESMLRSYTHNNPLVRYISYKRIEIATKMWQIDKKTVFDFGCGTGVLFPYLSNAKKIYACDLKDDMARKTAKDLNMDISFVKGLADINDNTIEIFFALDVFEHIENHIEFFELLKTKVCKNGIIIVSLPTETSFYKICRKIAGYDKSAHYHKSDPNNISELLKKNFKYHEVKKIPICFHLFEIFVLENLKF